MAAKHGTRHPYNDGCRCDECRGANAAYRQRYRQRQRSLSPVPNGTPAANAAPEPTVPAPSSRVSRKRSAVQVLRRAPAWQAALAMARILDDSKAVNQQPAAAKVLASLLDKLRSAQARNRRGRLAVVRTMSDKGGA